MALTRVGESVAGGAGLDDLTGEGEAVDDGGAEPPVGEGLGPAGERLVASDGDRGPLLPPGEYLEEQFGAGAGITDEAERVPRLDPGARRELVDHRRVDRGVGGEVELLDALVAREAGVADAPGGAALSRSSHSAITSSARKPR
jgi:hypothetical protein